MEKTLPVPLPAEDANSHPPAQSAAENRHERAPLKPARVRRGLRKLAWAVVVGLAFGAGWLLAGGANGQRDKEELPPDARTGQRNLSEVMVTIEPITHRPVQRSIEGFGTLHGFEEVSISAKVEGRVHRIHQDVADLVPPAELLLEIDPTDSELSVQQADKAIHIELAKLGLEALPDKKFDLTKVPAVVQVKARLLNLQSKLQRAAAIGSGAISAEMLANLRSDIEVAEGEYAHELTVAKSGLATIAMKTTALAMAQQQLKDTQIRAPTPTLPVPGAADGVVYAVSHRCVAEGTLVRPGTEVYKLVITQTLKLRVAVPQIYSAQVRVGQKVEVTTAAFPRPFAGTVARINPAVDPTTRAFEVEIHVPNPNGELKPGSFAKAAILTRLEANAATVPLTALVHFAGINKIFLSENGRAEEVQVALGVQTTAWAEIREPALPAGSQVVTSGQTILAAGTPIAVRTPAAKASSQAQENGR